VAQTLVFKYPYTKIYSRFRTRKLGLHICDQSSIQPLMHFTASLNNQLKRKNT
jgi:hypothetical protein